MSYSWSSWIIGLKSKFEQSIQIIIRENIVEKKFESQIRMYDPKGLSFVFWTSNRLMKNLICSGERVLCQKNCLCFQVIRLKDNATCINYPACKQIFKIKTIGKCEIATSLPCAFDIGKVIAAIFLSASRYCSNCLRNGFR